MFDPGRPRLPNVPIPTGLTLRQHVTLAILLQRLRIALYKEDHLKVTETLDELHDEGFREIANAIAGKLKVRLLAELALDSIPWASRHTPLHTWS